MFAKAPPILAEVRFTNQGVAPDWYLFEEQEELEAILDRLGPNVEVFLHCVWDLVNRKGALCLKR